MERSDISRLIECEKLLKEFVADIEAMKAEAPYDPDVLETDYWFGPFSLGHMDRHDYTHSIQWPNLGILLKKAERVLEHSPGAINVTK